MGRPPLGLGTYGKIRPRKLASGQWCAETLFRDLDGKTRPVKRHGKTRREAEQRLKDDLRVRQHVVGEDLTRFHTFAHTGELWLDDIRRRRRGSTYDRYRCMLRNQIFPALGEVRLHECSVGLLDRYLRSLEDDRGLAPNTVRGYRKVLHGVMAHAVRHGALTINPISGVLPIEGKGKESRGLTAAERGDLLDKVDADERAVADDLPDLMRYLLGTGVRIGEACALRWFRVDLDEGVVIHGDNLVREALACAECEHPRREHAKGTKKCPTGSGTWSGPDRKGLVLHEPKTEAGFRVLPLPDFVLMMLKLRYPGPEFGMAPIFPKFPVYPLLNPTDRRSSRSCRRVGEKRVTGLYRPTAAQGGRFLVDAWRDPNNTGRSIRKFRTAAACYPWLTAHVFRHTAATIMDQQGLTPREISGYLGHARPSFTQDKYLDRRQQSGAAARGIDAAMRSRV
jgi:integrase